MRIPFIPSGWPCHNQGPWSNLQSMNLDWILKTIQNAVSTINEAVTVINEALSMLDGYDKRITKNTEDIEALNALVNALDSDLSSLSTQLSALDERVQNNANLIATLRGDLSTTQATVAGHTGTLKKQGGEIDILTQNMQSAWTQIDENTSGITRHDTQISSNTAKVLELSGKVDNISAPVYVGVVDDNKGNVFANAFITERGGKKRLDVVFDNIKQFSMESKTLSFFIRCANHDAPMLSWLQGARAHTGLYYSDLDPTYIGYLDGNIRTFWNAYDSTTLIRLDLGYNTTYPPTFAYTFGTLTISEV